MNLKKVSTISVLAILTSFVVVACAGMYKFNYLANKDGYDVDGNKIEQAQLNEVLKVQWHELHLTLKNDLNENPPIAEVTEMFNNQYSIDSTETPTLARLPTETT